MALTDPPPEFVTLTLVGAGFAPPDVALNVTDVGASEIAGNRSNPALVVTACATTTAQLPDPAQSPPHAANLEPASDTAVSVVLAPLSNCALQPLEPAAPPVIRQDMPAGALVIVPLPAPAPVTETENFGVCVVGPVLSWPRQARANTARAVQTVCRGAWKTRS